MWYVAFSLGLFGSLHCVGMCGPLAIAFSSKESNTKAQNLMSALAYNLGRTTTYALLGLVFGLMGSFLLVTNLQKATSVLLGLTLIISFALTIDIENLITKKGILSRYYFRVRSLINQMMQQSKSYHPFQLGMANGLLPCGLVYLAIAGALATGTLLGGVIFMALFGLGTIPILLTLTTGIGLIPNGFRKSYRKALPYVTLGFGLFLIYRGIIVKMPAEINFWEALKSPVMCY